MCWWGLVKLVRGYYWWGLVGDKVRGGGRRPVAGFGGKCGEGDGQRGV